MFSDKQPFPRKITKVTLRPIKSVSTKRSAQMSVAANHTFNTFTDDKNKVIEVYADGRIIYELSPRGNKLLHYDGHKYIRNNVYLHNIYWKCTKWHSGCKARAITSTDDNDFCCTKNLHIH